jgi:hypothetical protein
LKNYEETRERRGQHAEEELRWAMSVLGWQEGEVVRWCNQLDQQADR